MSFKKLARILAFAALSAAAAISGANAAGITAPPDLSPGDTYRRMYITSTIHDALSNDVAVYNAFVAADAPGEAHLVALGTT